MELSVVSIIIGVLATIGIGYFYPSKERTLDREAQANLRLIIAAERIFRMEGGSYYDSGTVQPTATTNINTNLRLVLSSSNWNYLTKAIVGPPVACCAQATRVNGSDSRTWRINYPAETDPQPLSCP